MSRITQSTLNALIPSLVGLRITEVRLGNHFTPLSPWLCSIFSTRSVGRHLSQCAPLTIKPLSGLYSSLSELLLSGYHSNAFNTFPGVWILPNARPGGLFHFNELFKRYWLIFRKVFYVWGSRWSVGKIVFFLNRYSPFIDSSLSIYSQWLTYFVNRHALTSDIALLHNKDPNVLWCTFITLCAFSDIMLQRCPALVTATSCKFSAFVRVLWANAHEYRGLCFRNVLLRK